MVGETSELSFGLSVSRVTGGLGDIAGEFVGVPVAGSDVLACPTDEV